MACTLLNNKSKFLRYYKYTIYKNDTVRITPINTAL